ncbi:Imm26 family immunity protein [Stenotrophomonas sp. PD6]|uniref:Imm26 family immunity protein n=1 Tax=Stenotrophomonas sp. PD6 TaxID=3368612 RepID=UPI003BA2CD66
MELTRTLTVTAGCTLALPVMVRRVAGFAYCRVISREPSMGGAFLVEVFNHVSKRRDDAQNAIRQRRLFDPVLASFIFFGTHPCWRIVLRQHNFSKQDAGYNSVKIAYNKGHPPQLWQRGKSRVVKASELEGVEPAIVWIPAQLEERVEVELLGGKLPAR